jgi:hypothetical protein
MGLDTNVAFFSPGFFFFAAGRNSVSSRPSASIRNENSSSEKKTVLADKIAREKKKRALCWKQNKMRGSK